MARRRREVLVLRFNDRASAGDLVSIGLYGADPQELRAFAAELDHARQVLISVRDELGNRITNDLRWEGPDAFVFRHAWQSSYAPVITRTAAQLQDTAQLLRQQAMQQDQASS